MAVGIIGRTIGRMDHCNGVRRCDSGCVSDGSAPGGQDRTCVVDAFCDDVGMTNCVLLGGTIDDLRPTPEPTKTEC